MALPENAEPLACPFCGQSGAERPGLRKLALEAVGVDDGMVAMNAIACNACNRHWLVPPGSVIVVKHRQEAR